MSKLMNFINKVENNPREEIQENLNVTQHEKNFTVHALIDLLIYKGVFSIDEWMIAQENAEICGGVLSIEQEITLLNNLICRRGING